MIEPDPVIRTPQARGAEIFMSQLYTEDQLVEQPAIGLFSELGRLRAGKDEAIYH